MKTSVTQVTTKVQSFLVLVSMQMFIVSCLETNYETELSILYLFGHPLTATAKKSVKQVHQKTVSRVL